MGNRDSTYDRRHRRHRPFRLNSTFRNIAFVVLIAAFVALVLWALDL